MRGLTMPWLVHNDPCLGDICMIHHSLGVVDDVIHIVVKVVDVPAQPFRPTSSLQVYATYTVPLLIERFNP